MGSEMCIRDRIKTRTDAWYGGNCIIETLREEKFEVNIDSKKYKVSRWALIDVDDDLRNKKNLVEADLKAQNDKVHGKATIKAALETQTPSDFPYNPDGTQRPIVGIRVFHGGPQQAMNEYVYQPHYGYMHCNMAQDCNLHEGILLE